MGFYQLLVTLTCLIFLVLCNTLNGEAVAAAIKLKVNFEGQSPCSRETTSTDVCVLGVMYGELKLKCESEVTLNSSLTLGWYKSDNSGGAEEKWHSVTESAHRVTLSDGGGSLHFSMLIQDDVGRYVCKVTVKGQEKQDLAPLAQNLIEVQVLPFVVPAFKDLTVVEENTINVTCTVIGKASRIVWKFGEEILKNGSAGGRAELREYNGVQDATLLIKNANTTTDRGHYNCTAESKWGNSSNFGVCYVRVKSKYAALGPFLGICAEVIILCTIILIYEKKRDKTELEESDTDQGPETKSSPDHGQDSVRYRK